MGPSNAYFRPNFVVFVTVFDVVLRYRIYHKDTPTWNLIKRVSQMVHIKKWTPFCVGFFFIVQHQRSRSLNQYFFINCQKNNFFNISSKEQSVWKSYPETYHQSLPKVPRSLLRQAIVNYLLCGLIIYTMVQFFEFFLLCLSLLFTTDSYLLYCL